MTTFKSIYSEEMKAEFRYKDLRYLIMFLIMIATGNFILSIILTAKIIWGVN